MVSDSFQKEKQVKRYWVIKTRVLRNVLANNFALSEDEVNTPVSLNKGGIAGLPSLRTILAICQKYQEPSFWEVIDSFVLLAYASLTASRTFLKWSLASVKFTLDSEDLFYCYKQKKWFLWTLAAAQAAKNHGNEWSLTWYLRWGVYTSIPITAPEVLSLKISSHGTFLKWSQRALQSAQE